MLFRWTIERRAILKYGKMEELSIITRTRAPAWTIERQADTLKGEKKIFSSDPNSLPTACIGSGNKIELI